MAVLLKCPVCKTKYRWNAGVETAPEFCPNPECDWQDTKRADDDVVMPAFLSPRTKATDKVYRDMERGSEQRMHLAAEAAGCSASDMASLKITNLKDAKEGEISAAPVVNDVTKHMEQTAQSHGAQWGFQNNGAEYSKGIATGDVTVNGQTTRGIAPRAGMSTLQALNRLNRR